MSIPYGCVKDEKITMIHWHGWRILLIDNSCKQKAQLRLMKIEIARCNLAGEKSHLSGSFDHNLTTIETKLLDIKWNRMKKRIRKLVIWRILCAVLTNVPANGAQWGSRGREFDSRHSDHKSNDFTLEIVGFFCLWADLIWFWPQFWPQCQRFYLVNRRGSRAFLNATSSAAICEPALMPTIWKAGSR